MRQIEQLYKNDFGMAFYWKNRDEVVSDKVQLVFKETGFHFTVAELDYFIGLIDETASKNHCCDDCKIKHQCTRFLLRTPCPQIDLAVSMQELDAIKDLVEGTLFKINLQEYLLGIGRN
ncbi:MAG: hypothetical protein PSV16_12170 [Flavobacterium sp.]|nr:hypothetical protein [Flavobacterium sp.]